MIVVRRYSNNVKLKKTKVTVTEDTKIKVDRKPKMKKKKDAGKIDPFLGYGEGKKQNK